MPLCTSLPRPPCKRLCAAQWSAGLDRRTAPRRQSVILAAAISLLNSVLCRPVTDSGWLAQPRSPCCRARADRSRPFRVGTVTEAVRSPGHGAAAAATGQPHARTHARTQVVRVQAGRALCYLEALERDILGGSGASPALPPKDPSSKHTPSANTPLPQTHPRSPWSAVHSVVLTQLRACVRARMRVQCGCA